MTSPPAAAAPRARGFFTRTFLVTGGLTLGALLLLLLGGTGPKVLGALLLVFVSPVFAVSALRHLLRGMLWRVGSRLFLSYVLIGVVPLPFLLGLAVAATMALSGQLAARRAGDLLARRSTALLEAARALARGEPADEVVRRSATLLPELSAATAPSGGAWKGSPPPAFANPAALPPGERTVVAMSGESLALVATVKGAAGEAACATLPLGPKLEEALAAELELPLRILGASGRKDDQGVRLDVGDEKDAAPRVTQKDVPRDTTPGRGGRGLLRGRWVGWIAATPFDAVDAKNGAPLPGRRAVLFVRTSIAGEMGRLFSGPRFGEEAGTDSGSIVFAVMKGLALFVVFVYLAAALLSALLVVRIARATHRLSLGLAAVERGDFTYRATLKGRDQLAALVEGFNRMAAHLSAAVSERAERETLERELEVARALQRRLLPPADFAFPGLQIAADFRPAAAIGGDFYHLLPESATRLSVVIADVSGHGLPAGIVMASAKASLSALAATGMDAPALLATLDEEIRRSTESRTFVTLAHLRFDLAARTVAYTNAGHVYPYVVRASGEVRALPNPARPLGLGLPASYTTVSASLETEDLWVLVSDGIVEARDAAEREFGYERLEALLAESPGVAAAALSSRILEAWRAHTGSDEPEDDRTLLVLRVLPPATAPPARR